MSGLVPTVLQTFYLTIKRKREREEYFPKFPILFLLIFHWQESNHITFKERKGNSDFTLKPYVPRFCYEVKQQSVLGKAGHLYNNNDEELLALSHQ